MKRIAIQDANIMIDLIKTGLFDYCLALDYLFSTTNIILDELYDIQIDVIRPHIASGKFTIIEITEDEITEIQKMSLEETRLSEQDWSAVFYAQKKQAFILSGDRRLRQVAEAKGLTTYGILWILDQIVDKKILIPKQACSFLKELMLKNNRLPLEECEKRVRLWCR